MTQKPDANRYFFTLKTFRSNASKAFMRLDMEFPGLRCSTHDSTQTVDRCSFLTLFDFTGHCSTLFGFTGHCSIFYSTLFDLSEIFRFYRELAEASRTTTKFDIICKIPQPGQPPNIIENTTNLSIVDSYSPYGFVESLVVGLSINQTKNGYVSMYVKYPKWVKVKKIEVKFTLTLP